MRTRAAVLYEREKSEPYVESSPLIIEDVELEAPGEGEVLVEIAGAGLCHSDLSTLNGALPRPLPMILGHEAGGIVREIGAGVKDLQVGDHVVFSFVPICRPGEINQGFDRLAQGSAVRQLIRFAS